MDYEIERIAFEGPKTPDRGYTCRVSYLKSPKGSALIEILKENKPIRSFLFPAYKIYNIQAHFSEIVDSEIENNIDGYKAAAWNGF
jgi:hypothetical protein